MISVENIRKNYGDLEVLKGVSFQVDKGEIVSIVGESGAGKSTLLHILGTLDNADSGRYKIDGNNVFDLSEKELASYRNREIGFIFQFHHLLPEFSALENVCIPAFIQGKKQAEVENDARNLLKFLNIEARADHKPNQLSGGEQQRVAVARALINKPSLVMADEPSGNLDSKNSLELHELFFKLRDEFEQTFIIVTHNEQLSKMTDRILEMKDGIIL